MSSLRKAVQLLVGAMGVLLLCAPLFSQGVFGRLWGTITDQSSGVISGATVSVTDTDRGVTKSLVTNEDGIYNAPNLTPGSYKVRVEAKGFKAIERQNVELGVGKEVRVDLTLQPGDQVQTITITESIPLVETTNAVLGGTLNNADVNDMPLNGRNYQNLLGLRPGVMTYGGGSPWTQSTNNSRPDESVWMVDGIINANFYDYRPISGMPSPFTDGATILPVDAIQEFNLMENPKAEYGWRPGAVVNVGIKSGTNTIHGSAYGFYRSSKWAARNVFNPAPTSKLPTALKQFGGTVGGPVKKDKLFYFAAYEGLRSLVGNAISSKVPELAGQPTPDPTHSMVDAINAVALSGGSFNTALVSPVSLNTFGCTVGVAAANTVCTGGLIQGASQNTTNYVSSFPNTNISDNGIAKIDYHINSKHTVSGMVLIGNYLGDGEDHPITAKYWQNKSPIRTYTVSSDWVWAPSSRVVNEARFAWDRVRFALIPDDGTKFANGTDYKLNTGITSTGGFPNVVMTGYPGEVLGSWRGRPVDFQNPYYSLQDTVSYLLGKHTFKFGGEFTHIEATFNVHDTRGRINFKGGKCPTISGSTPLEDFFCGKTAGGTQLLGTTARKLNWREFAGFVQDDWRLAPKLMVNLGLRYSYISPMKEANNLFGNFDPTSPTGLVQQGQASVGDTLWKPDRKNFSPRVGFAYDVSGKGTTVVRGGLSVIYSMFTTAQFTQSPFQNFRGGSLAANPTGACNVSVPAGSTCATTPNGSGGFGTTLGGTIDAGTVGWKAANLNWNGVVFPAGGVTSCTASNPCDITAVNPNLLTPYLTNWNLSVTHAFTNNLSLEVGYVGNHGSRLTGIVDLNQSTLGSGWCINSPLTAAQLAGECAGASPAIDPSAGVDGTAEQQARPFTSKFPYLEFINQTTNNSRSNYHSLQATLTERTTHGLSFTAGYTFGHGLDNGSLNRFANLPQNSSSPGTEYGNSDFDSRHRLTVTASYQIPGIKGFAQLLEGWKLNSILTLQSGLPWLVDDNGLDISGTGDLGDRWNFSGNPADFKSGANSIPYCTGPNACSLTSGISGATIAAPDGWSKCLAAAPDKTATGTLATFGCFVSGNSVMVPPKLGTFGTMGRNIFRDSGFRDVDFSVFKTFAYRERYRAEFRVEFFNLFNHPIISNPYGAANGAQLGYDPSAPTSFGCGCATPDVAAGNPLVGSGSSRVMQLGLKLTF